MRRTHLAFALLLSMLLASCQAPVIGWQTVFEDLDTGLISVWGTSATDVWAVGGDDGRGPLVIHYDGSAWERVATGVSGIDLWWVTGLGAGDPMFFGGDRGTILRYDGATFTRMTTPDDTRTVFGIFVASASDAWAVGGAGGVAGFIWRWDGTEWRDVPLPAGVGSASIFKAWGSSASDVWFVGGAGVILHWDGMTLSPVTSGTMRTILTVHTRGPRAAAVGGAGTAVVLELDPATGTWSDVTPPLAPQMLGVWLTDQGGWAVGLNGAVLRRDATAWTFDDTAPSVAGALHSVWVDPTGGVWAVGGQILSAPFSAGALFHHGASVNDQMWVE